MDVGFVGLGMMGSGMAANLVKAGHRVRAWNRSPRQLAGVGAASSPADAFGAEVVFNMLADDAAIRDVLLSSGVLARVRPGVVHVVTATISVAFADELRQRHEDAGVAYVAAPVFGRPDVAAAGQLGIVAAGAPAAIATAQPLFDVIGRKTWVMGEDPKQANAAKIAGNMMIAMAIEAMAEAAVLAESNGLVPEAFLGLMLETQFGGSRAYENYGKKIVDGDFVAGFKMSLGLKDLSLAVAAGEASGKSLPMLAALRRRMADAVEAGMGDQDWSGVAGFTRSQPGQRS